MSDAVAFEVLATEGRARRGRLTTARGTVETPVFMPVGTRGAVVHLDASDYEALGAQIVLANTYHLMLRPGADVVERLGGLHGFTSWGGHFLTDSGGYQVMSLRPRVDDGGVTFASTYDGTRVRLTPEDAVAIQVRLGADIQMVLDQCPALPASRDEVVDAMERTHRWAERARRCAGANGQAVFGIVQGGTDPELRALSARHIASLDFDGYGIGGLSVGETRAETGPALEAATAELPADRPRYLMGVGDPIGIVDAVAAGVDMFDCVLPTRLARHGTVLTSSGRLNLRNSRHSADDAPLDPEVPTSARYSRGYLRHLLKVNEPTAGRILTLHNVAYLLDLVGRVREAIGTGGLDALRAEVRRRWAEPAP
jgi:queuine tRNA-ribosyltransferase